MSSTNIVLYHAVPTRSCRVAWLLEELGVPYTIKAVDFPAELSTPEFLAKNPIGTCVICCLPPYTHFSYPN